LVSIAFDNLDVVSRIIKPAWLNTLSLATELHGAENICNAIGRRIVKERSLTTVSIYEITTYKRLKCVHHVNLLINYIE